MISPFVIEARAESRKTSQGGRAGPSKMSRAAAVPSGVPPAPSRTSTCNPAGKAYKRQEARSNPATSHTRGAGVGTQVRISVFYIVSSHFSLHSGTGPQ